ncbi:hypothetical protein D3C80_1573500 [compost metagenome]
MLAVGRSVSIAKLFESVVPVPLLPAWSVTPALFSVMTLLVSLILPFGVRVAVQVIPPSALLKSLTTPLATLRSSRPKPLTASLKVMVT